MTEETNAQTLAGLAEGTTTTTNEAETNTRQEAQNGQLEQETKPTDLTVENQEAAEQGEQPEADDDAETKGQEGKQKRSRSDRYKSRIAAQAARIAELEGLLGSDKPGKEAPKPPKLEDFNYDQQAYEDARLEYNTQHAVTKALSETRKQENETRLREARAELVEEFSEGVTAIKDRIADYDQVMDSCKIDLRKDIGDLILSSDKGPHLAYELAKNNGAKLREIQSLPPNEAARAIGRIEARLSLPQPKKQTQAPTPIKPPVGGAAPSRDIASLAKSEDATEVIEAMRAKARA
ncbi:MAG: hypothetical protein KIT15_17065 [Xanthobacteraceae bacterium]|nr:hypothetical protein [Xanthobacteraceae bacterium]